MCRLVGMVSGFVGVFGLKERVIPAFALAICVLRAPFDRGCSWLIHSSSCLPCVFGEVFSVHGT